MTLKGTVRFSLPIAFLGLLTLTSLSTGLRAQGPNRAGLVVQFGADSYITRCVEFAESQITGYDLLLRSGLDVEASVGVGMGALLCEIEDVGCPVTNCMCDHPPNYWSYWHLAGEEWIYSQAGVSGYPVSPGDVEGWSWGEGNPPVALSFDQICAPPATDTATPTLTSTPSPSPTTTDTPAPTPTWTPRPSHTATPIPPSATPLPTDTPLPTASATPAPVSAGAPETLATEARNTTAPTPTTRPSHTPPTTTEAPERLASPTAASSPIPVEEVPSPKPPTTAPEVLASPTPVRTRLAVADRSLAVEGTAAPAGSAQPTSTTKAMTFLPMLLTMGAGLAYVLFLLFVILLAVIYGVARLRRTRGETP